MKRVICFKLKSVKNLSLVLVLLISIIGGCTGAPNVEPTATNSSTPLASALATPASSEAQESSKSEGYTLPLTDTPATLTIAILEGPPEFSLAGGDLAIWKEIEKETGVTMNWEVSADHYTTIKVRIAANSLPDIFAIDGTVNIIELFNSGITADHDTLIRNYAPNIYKTIMENDQMKACLTSEDRIYAATLRMKADYYGNPNTMYYRKDWQEKLDIPDPVTANDYYDMFLAFKNNDPNGNGEKDEVPILSGTFAGFSPLGSAFGFGAEHIQNGWKVKDGTVIWEYMQPEFVEYLEYLKKYYDNGILPPELYLKDSEIAPLVSANRLGAYTNGIGACQSNNSIILKNGYIKNLEDGYTWLLPPADQMGIREIVNRPASESFSNVISKTSKNQELAIKWLDYVWAHPEGRLYELFGIKDETYTIDESGKLHLTTAVTESSLGVQTMLRSLGGLAPYQTYETSEDFAILWESFPFLHKIIQDTAPYISTTEFPVPPMLTSTDISAEIASLQVETNTYIEEMFAKFIMGKEPLGNYSDFIKNLRSMGGDRLVEIKQQTYNSIFKK